MVTGDRTGVGLLTGHFLTGPVTGGPVDRWTCEISGLRSSGLRSGTLPRARDGLPTLVETGLGEDLRLGDRLSYVLLVLSMCSWPTVNVLQASQLRPSMHGS